MSIDGAVAGLRNRGWTVEFESQPELLLPPELARRYPRVPADLTAFLLSLRLCASPKRTAWLLTSADFHGTSDSAFPWNHIEEMSKSSADGDSELLAMSRDFWNAHLPFMMAVHSGYDFLAIRLVDGAVVHGSSPDWEETSDVAPSTAALLALIAESDGDSPFPVAIFLNAD